MITRNENGIKKSYPQYLVGMVVRLAKKIPPDRRTELADEITARASIMGCQNDLALKAALKKLKEES